MSSSYFSAPLISQLTHHGCNTHRIKEANTAAAAFYTKCLITLPTAGKARAHLRSRGISPKSVRTFALGYAPDCYFGEEKKMGKKRRRGPSGSLVEFLAEAGFAPAEIVEAGLAVPTKSKQVRQPENTYTIKKFNETHNNSRKSPEPSNENEDEQELKEDKDEQYDYSDLMDRFRSRLIVPILDASGQGVIALGGRHIASHAETGSNKKKGVNFTPPKYINSPDSLVFTKKNVLFNQFLANVALEADRGSSSEGSTSLSEDGAHARPAVIIVEGYLDAIALFNVGVHNVVASMGTALPAEQLTIAAQMGNVPGGRIIICMDNDNAGQNAVERLLGSNILSNVPNLNRNELYVATLPTSLDDVSKDERVAAASQLTHQVKDPADFVAQCAGDACRRFRHEVLHNAIPWDEWYVARIISRHRTEAKDGEPGSFSSLCEEVSTFLATFSNPAERTRRVTKIGSLLVDLIKKEEEEQHNHSKDPTSDSESTRRSASALGMLRVQLESDILNMSSRKAEIREAMERRIERVPMGPGDEVGKESSTAAKIKELSHGYDKNDEDSSKMSRNSTRFVANANGTPSPLPRPGVEDRRQLPAAGAVESFTARVRTKRSFPKIGSKRKKERQKQPHLVPHFDGFIFRHRTDRDWLGFSSNGKMRPKMHLGEVPPPPDEKDRIRAETPMFETQYKPKRQSKEVVYFNSNQYLGREFLSSDALLAGYEQDNDRPLPGESIVEFSERKLFQSDPDRLILQAEARLLHALAKFPQARAAMRETHLAATFGPAQMRWTSTEREWLFGCLTGSPAVDRMPTEMLDGGTSSQLRQYLAGRPDCPKLAFGSRDVSKRAPSSGGVPDSGIIETAIESRDHTGYSMNVSAEKDDNCEAEQRENLNDIVSAVEVVGFDLEELDSSLNFLDAETERKTESACDDACYTSGSLDEYFLDQPDMFPSFSDGKIAHETRAELTVQESVATILRATAMKRFALSKSKLATIISEMDRRDNGDGDGGALANNRFSHVSSEELQELFEKTGTETVEAQKSLYETERSTDRVNSHLLDYSVINGSKYKQSQAELERLDKVMEDHCATLPEDTHRPDTPGGDGSYVFGSDQFSDGPIDPMFGGRNPDEYVIRGLPNGESVFE